MPRTADDDEARDGQCPGEKLGGVAEVLLVVLADGDQRPDAQSAECARILL
jgi:hypothetical protein